jgi:uncharacterized phiE125 gp8 family phage protein
MSLKLITAPATTPVSLTEAKAHLRVDHSDEDTLITALIAAATEHYDGPRGILSRALMQQTWDLLLDEFPAGPAIRFPLGPLISVTEVAYIDPDTEIEAIFASSNYQVDIHQPLGWVQLAESASWPDVMQTINAVRVRFVAGYADAAAVPAPIKAAILLNVGDLYKNRETAAVGAVASAIPMSPTTRALTDPYRLRWF